MEPFEYALETLNVDTGSASASLNSTPERASSADNVILTPERSRSLRGRTGKKRTRSVSPPPTVPAVTTTLTTTTPMKIDGENLLGSSKPDEEDCIHVQNISAAILPPPKKRSKTPEQAKTTKIAALGPQKASTNIIMPVVEKAGDTSGGTTERLQENPSPPANATQTLAPMAKLPKLQEKPAPTPPTLMVKPTKLRTSLPTKKGQQTLFSFFTPKPVALTGPSTKTGDSVTVKPDTPIVSHAVSNTAPIFGGVGGGCGGAKNKDVATKATEVMVMRKSTTPPARPLRPGTRKSARDVTVKSRETVNYREDSDSDIDLE